MTQSSTTNFAEITAGFINLIEAVGPMIPFAAPDLKLTALISLEKPDKKVFIDMGARPVKVEMDSSEEKGDVTFATDADLFHYILWGELLLTRAINEQIVLLQIKTGSLPDMPTTGGRRRKKKGDPKPRGKNKLYEAYLINIGAAHLLEEKNGYKFPPDPDREIRTIQLDPPSGGKLLAGLVYATAFIMGFFGGILLRIFRKKLTPKKQGPPKVEIVSLEEAFKPPPPPAPHKPPSGFRTFFFSRVNIVTLIGSLIKGLAATGALKKPLDLGGETE